MLSLNIKQLHNKRFFGGIKFFPQEATAQTLWHLVFLPVVIVAVITMTGGVARADDFSSTNFVIKDPVIKPGAGFATSDTYQLWSSLGQEAIGISTAGSFTLKAGFLYFPGATTATTSTPPVVVVAPPGGGGGPPLGPYPTTTPPLVPLPSGLICDFNRDGRCNIIDLSIMLYYVDKPYTIAAPYDLNKNGRVDFPDVSVLLYYWT